ncbi:hypothetical protein EVG20_g4834 [Dentipellis fragilis]|uniref:PX domain-containing protein n=1 Tax=Dentipellis fragilis TaxID=205917 RepID=A0A4Y9YX95_9AGAM|nr:hypothetical protein EVG20_g4834 [Dentipellis fragilis]
MTGASSLLGQGEPTITRHSTTPQHILKTASGHESRLHCHDCEDDPMVEIVVGECIPDGAGGCQRSRSRGLSTSGTGCCAGAPQEGSLADGLPIEDTCCAAASIKDDDGCCSDCGRPESSGADSCKDECCAITEVKISADKNKDACCSACDSPPPSEADGDSCKDDCCAGLTGDDCCTPAGVIDVTADVGCCSDCGPGSEEGAASCKDLCCVKSSDSTTDEKDDCCSGCAPSDVDSCKDACCGGGDSTQANSKKCCGDTRVLATSNVDCHGGASEPEKAACQSRCCDPKVEDASASSKRPQALLQSNDVVPAQMTPPTIRHRHLQLVTRATAASETDKSARGLSTSSNGKHSHTTHVRLRNHHHHKRTGSASGSSNCSMETTFGRFFEAACCCLIDWGKAGLAARRSTRRHHHHKPAHKHAHSNETRRSADKTTIVRPATGGKKTSKNTRSTFIYPADLSDTELGAKDLRPLVLSVHGMDCPSCASKLTRALLTLPSVANVKVNMFTDQATLTYAEGLVLPEVIAKRAGDMTGFKCAVLEEANINQEGSMKIMRIGIPNTPSTSASWDVGMDLDTEKLDLPKSIRVHSIKQSSSVSQGLIILEVEYDGSVIQPRTVLAAFEPWEGTFLPTPKSAPGLQASLELRSLFYRTLISAVFCVPVLVFSWAPLPPAHATIYGALSLALTTLIQTLIAYPLYSSALRSLFFQHLIDMDLLVVLSSTIAYVFSAVAFFLRVAGNNTFSTPFFETPAMLVTLIMLGRLVSAFARRRATQALDGIRAMQADTVDLVPQHFGGSTVTISSELVHLSDILRVAPDSLVPTDGTVVRGASQVDESSVTGESMPVEKATGAKLTAGTLNLSGELYMRVARLPADNTVSDIGKLMLQVQESRLPVQDMADRAASYLAPTILALSVLTFVVWVAVGLRVRNQSGQDAAVGALRYAVAVLVVSCPCALVLCVPMVAVISAAVAAKEGVLFKSVQAVQYAKNIDAVVFDKTGTLTTGQLAVAESRILDCGSLGRILGLVSGSRHPVAEAVAKHIRETYPDVKNIPLKGLKSVPGRGMEAQDGSTRIRGGNIAWLGLASSDVLRDMLSAAHKPLTFFAVMVSNTSDFTAANLVAVFGLTDTIRPSARDTVQLLAQQGVDVYIVSGDELPVVKALASELRIDESHAVGRCLPQGKLDYVRSLQAGDRARKTVMFVGDGTNDGLALAQADVGVSFSAGTDIALSAADVVILDSDAVDLARSLRVVLEISNGAVRRIVLNFAWALVYNVFAVLLAAGAFVRVRIAPEYAGLGEMVSVVPVVLVAWTRESNLVALNAQPSPPTYAMDSFDDLLRQSTRALEENPFDDPFAKPRSGSPDPWASTFLQTSAAPHHDFGASAFEDVASTTPPAEDLSYSAEPSVPDFDPLDSANANLSDEEESVKPTVISPKSSGFRESIEESEPAKPSSGFREGVDKEEPAADEHKPPLPPPQERTPTPPPRALSPPQTPSSSTATTEPEAPKSLEAPSPPPTNTRFPQTHTPRASSSSFASPRSSLPAPLDSQRSVISPLDQPTVPASPFASLALGGESFGGGWDGTQSSFVNTGHMPISSSKGWQDEDEDDDDDDKPLRPRPITSEPTSPKQAKAPKTENGIQPTFVITVDDPQKVGDPIRGYTMYTVHTRTTSPTYSKSQFSVLRRYSDFLWLYETLSANNPGVVVPPVPEKNPFGRFDDQFVQQRRMALETCIMKIANHPVLMKDADLKLFLESDTFSLDIKHRKAEIAQERGSGGLMYNLGLAGLTQTYVETDEWFDRQKSYLDTMETQLRSLVKAIEVVSKHRRGAAQFAELSASIGEFAQTIQDLVASDVGRSLQQSLSGLAEVERNAQDLESEQSQQDMVTILSTADEYARLINSVRMAFSSRIRLYHVWEKADADRRRVKTEHERNRSQGRIQPDRIGHTMSQIADAERRALDAKQDFDNTSKLVKAELARFEKERIEDFKKSLEKFLDGMIAGQKALIAARENFQQELLKKVSSSDQQNVNGSSTTLTSVA